MVYVLTAISDFPIALTFLLTHNHTTSNTFTTSYTCKPHSYEHILFLNKQLISGYFLDFSMTNRNTGPLKYDDSREPNFSATTIFVRGIGFMGVETQNY